MNSMDITRNLLRQTLQLGDRADSLEAGTHLMGNFPELNSLTVVALIAAIEEQLGCEIYDDEISGEIFETVGSLAAFVDSKL